MQQDSVEQMQTFRLAKQGQLEVKNYNRLKTYDIKHHCTSSTGI